jgi:hypothetical protein
VNVSIIGDIVGSISKAVLPSVIDSAFADTGSLAHASPHVKASSVQRPRPSDHER